jgi:hypothetical protein
VVLPQFSSEGVIHGWAYFSIAPIGHPPGRPPRHQKHPCLNMAVSADGFEESFGPIPMQILPGKPRKRPPIY